MTGALMTPESYLRDLEREAERLPRDERRELMEGMRARVGELLTRGLDDDEMAKALGGLGDPRRMIDEYLAVVGEPARPPYRSVLVIIALACVWLSLVSGVAMDPALLLFHPLLALLGLLASLINSVAPLAALVLSIVGRMWRRWLDGVLTLLLVLLAPSSPVFLFFSTGTLAGSPHGSAHLTRWVFRGLFALTVAVIVVGTLHWTRRLVVQARGRLDTRGRGIVLAVGGSSVLVLGAMATVVFLLRFVLSPPFVQPAAGGPFDVRLVNDTGHDVTVTYCPRQDCHGQQAIPLSPGMHYDLTAVSGTLPDSVVVQAGGQPTTCALLSDVSPPSGFVALSGSVRTRLRLSRAAKAIYCGGDIESLDPPTRVS